MNKEAIEQLIMDLDQKISDMVRQRDHLRAVVTLADQLDAATADRLVSGIIGAMRAKAAEVDTMAGAALLTGGRPESQ
jgi:hypothetical protein